MRFLALRDVLGPMGGRSAAEPPTLSWGLLAPNSSRGVLSPQYTEVLAGSRNTRGQRLLPLLILVLAYKGGCTCLHRSGYSQAGLVIFLP